VAQVTTEDLFYSSSFSIFSISDQQNELSQVLPRWNWIIPKLFCFGYRLSQAFTFIYLLYFHLIYRNWFGNWVLQFYLSALLTHTKSTKAVRFIKYLLIALKQNLVGICLRLFCYKNSCVFQN